MRIGIKSKLLIMLLCVSIASITIVSVLSYFRSRDALSDSVTAQLNSGRGALGAQIDSYFDTIEGQAFTLAEDRMIVEATLEFGVGWNQLDDSTLALDEAAQLNSAYRDFIATLPDAGAGETVEQYQPDVVNAQYLQYQYLVGADGGDVIDDDAIDGDDAEVSDRSALDDAGDGTFYSRAHRRYHPALRNFTERFGFYDLLLIDARTGDILYSVGKEIDFATNLVNGPHRNTNLARLVADVRANPQPGRVEFIDYEFYAPSSKAPAAFVASPVINPSNGDVIGVLALQLPVDEINRIMTADGNWEDIGFGETGESYLVGPDLTMRSQARALVEDPAAYFEAVEGRVSTESTALIEQYGSTTLLQPVDTDAARRALNGRTDTRVTDDYLGNETLSAFAPLDLGGLRWAIITQVDIEQANRPVNDLQRQLLIATGVIVLLLTALAMALSAVFVRPINKLIAWADDVRGGHLDPDVDVGSRDEFGELGGSFSQMVGTLRDQRAQMEAQNAENEALLLAIMPAAIAERLKAGEERIADEYPNVTVISTQITGFDQLTLTASAGAAAAVLNDLADGADELAERHGIQNVKLNGAQHIAACGLLQPRLDHQRRAVEFALDLRSFVDGYSKQYREHDDVRLSAAIGLSSGVGEAGVIGRTRPVFDVWGATVSHADVLSDRAEPGEILVTERVREHLGRQFDFADHEPIDAEYTRLDNAVLRGRVATGQLEVSEQATTSSDEPAADAVEA